MTRTKINFKPLIVIFISIVTLAITTLCLRQWNRNHRAGLGLRDGIEAFEKKQWKPAAENLGKYIAIFPNDVSAIMKYAEAQIKIRPMNISTINQSLNSYRRVLRIDPSYKKAALSLINIYMQILNNPAEAELIATQFLKHRQDFEVRRSLAMSLYRQRKFQQSRQELMSIIQNDPKEVTAYALLAGLAEERPDDFTEQPKKLYDQAVQNCPSNPLAYIVRGEYYLRQSNKQDAVNDFIKAENFSLSDITVRLRLAEAFNNSEMPEKARTHLRLAEVSDPDNIKLWHLWAKLAISNDSLTEMKEVAQKGCKALTADQNLFLPTAAELYIRCGDFENASLVIAQLEKTDGSAAKVAYLRGIMARKQGDTLKAVELLKKAQKGGLNYDQLHISLASALAGSGDINSAIISLRKYTTRGQYLSVADLMLAEYLAQVGKYRQAAEMTNRYLHKHPDNIRAQLMLSGFQSQINSQYEEKKSTTPMKKLQQNILNKMKNGSASLTDIITAVGVFIENRNIGFARQLIDSISKQHPSNLDVRLAEIDILIAEKDNQQANIKLTRVIETYPDSVKAMRYYTAFHIRQKNLETCEKVLSKFPLASSTEDDARTIKMLLAEVYERLKDYDNAWKVLMSLHENNPLDIIINRWLISIADNAEMTDQAQPLIDNIKDAEGPQGWQWRYEQAKLWLKSGDFEKLYEQIVNHLMENLKTNPQDQASRLLLAAVYEKSGNYQLASSIYKQALNYSADDIEITLAAVSAMQKAGEYELAEQIIKNARSMGITDRRLSSLQLKSYIRKGDYSAAGMIAGKLSAEDPNDARVKYYVAILNIRDKKYDLAQAALNELKQINPDSIPVTTALVDLNVKLNKPDRAIADCNDLINTAPTANAYTLRGRTYMRTGEPSKASEDLQKALKIDPESIPAMILLSRIYQTMELREKAVLLISKAVEMAPTNFDAHKTAALIYLNSQDPQYTVKTVEVMQKALELNPDDVEMLMLNARLLFAKTGKSEYNKAIRILRKITRLDPMYPQAWAILAEIHLINKDYDSAMDTVMKGLSYLPSSRMLYLSKARVQADQDPKVALETLTKLRLDYPDDTDIALYLAYMYITAGKSSDAVKLLRSLEVEEGSDESRKIETALAEALYAAGRSGESIKIIQSLYELYPDSKMPLMAHVRMLKSEKNWNELSKVVMKWYRSNNKHSDVPLSIIHQILDYKKPETVDCSEIILREIIEEDYGNVDALNSLGILLHITGRSAEALRYYEKVLMIDPDRVIAINNMAWILCEEQNKFQQALELTRLGLEKYPDYIDLIDTAGVAKYRLGRYQESVKDFKKCIQLSEDADSASAGIHYHLARSLNKLSLFTEAVHHLEKALELNKLNGGLSKEQLAEVNMLLSEISERY